MLNYFYISVLVSIIISFLILFLLIFKLPQLFMLANVFKLAFVDFILEIFSFLSLPQDIIKVFSANSFCSVEQSCFFFCCFF